MPAPVIGAGYDVIDRFTRNGQRVRSVPLSGRCCHRVGFQKQLVSHCCAMGYPATPSPAGALERVASNLLSIYLRSVVRSLAAGGAHMIKALFTMILLSNDHAARLVERFQRLRV